MIRLEDAAAEMARFRQIEGRRMVPAGSRPMILTKRGRLFASRDAERYGDHALSLYLCAEPGRNIFLDRFASLVDGRYERLRYLEYGILAPGEVSELLTRAGFSRRTLSDAQMFPVEQAEGEETVVGVSLLTVGIEWPPWDTEPHLALFTVDRRKEAACAPSVLSRLFRSEEGPAWPKWKRIQRLKWVHSALGQKWTRGMVDQNAYETSDPHCLHFLDDAKKGLEEMGFGSRVVDRAFPDPSWAGGAEIERP